MDQTFSENVVEQLVPKHHPSQKELEVSKASLSKKGKGFMVLTQLINKLQKKDPARMWSDHEDWTDHNDSPW